MSDIEDEVKITPVPIHVASVAAGLALSDTSQGTTPPKRQFRTKYETFVLTANDQSECILAQADDRDEFFVLAVDNDVVIGPTKGVAANPSNIVAGTPNATGAYCPKGILMGPFQDNGQLYAGVTTTASSSRVTVISTYAE